MSDVSVTGLKESVCLCTSTPNMMGTGVCSQKSKGLLIEEMVPYHLIPRVIGELGLKDMAP